MYSNRPACLSKWEEKGQRRESRGSSERRRGKGGEKRERERDNKEDGGPLPADAVDLCSIQCVMAASYWSSQSQYSCHWRIHPLQVMRSTQDQQREPLNTEWHIPACSFLSKVKIHLKKKQL